MKDNNNIMSPKDNELTNTVRDGQESEEERTACFDDVLKKHNFENEHMTDDNDSGLADLTREELEQTFTELSKNHNEMTNRYSDHLQKIVDLQKEIGIFQHNDQIMGDKVSKLKAKIRLHFTSSFDLLGMIDQINSTTLLNETKEKVLSLLISEMRGYLLDL